MSEVPLKPIKRIIKDAGADRVAKDAVKELRDEVEEFAEERASEALGMADHAERKTVKAKDVEASR